MIWAGRQLEVGAKRAPILLISYIFFLYLKTSLSFYFLMHDSRYILCVAQYDIVSRAFCSNLLTRPLPNGSLTTSTAELENLGGGNISGPGLQHYWIIGGTNVKCKPPLLQKPSLKVAINNVENLQYGYGCFYAGLVSGTSCLFLSKRFILPR